MNFGKIELQFFGKKSDSGFPDTRLDHLHPPVLCCLRLIAVGVRSAAHGAELLLHKVPRNTSVVRHHKFCANG